MAMSLLTSPSLVSIRDKSFIKPSFHSPHALRLHKLSFIDQSLSNMYIPLAFFYPKLVEQREREDSKNIHELSHIAHLLQTSLSKTLVSYYPYAGKLRDNAIVDCNDSGAEFLSVRINCHMSEILDHHDASHAESIVFPKDLPWANNYEGGNLLVVQLSKFDCGGIAISVCLSHKIGDGCSVINFLNDWASLTSGYMTTTSSPTFVGDTVFSTQNYGPLIAPQIKSDVNNGIQKRFVFSADKLDALRAKVASESGVENPTRAEVVSALLFKCAIKAASSTTASMLMRPSKLVHYLNVRTMIKPRLRRSAVGNLLSVFSIEATNEQDIELPMLVRNLRKEVEVAYKKDQVQQNELVLEVVESMRKGKIPFEDENIYLCSNLCKYPLYRVDFGWGQPERVSMPNGPSENVFFLKDYKDGRGVEARVMLHKQHVYQFERDQQLLQLID